jgi:hypothetical protein
MRLFVRSSLWRPRLTGRFPIDPSSESRPEHRLLRSMLHGLGVEQGNRAHGTLSVTVDSFVRRSLPMLGCWKRRWQFDRTAPVACNVTGKISCNSRGVKYAAFYYASIRARHVSSNARLGIETVLPMVHVQYPVWGISQAGEIDMHVLSPSSKPVLPP